MTFGRRSVGLVLSGWLIAGAVGAGCAGPAADGDGAADAADAAAEPSLKTAAAITTVSPTPTMTTTAPPFPFTLDPRIDNPAAACDAVLDGSTFDGYLIEPTGDGLCPAIGTSTGTWQGDANWRPVGDEEQMEMPRNAYFVAAKADDFCVYRKTTTIFIYPPPSPAQNYGALQTALGYPYNVSRDLLGVLCKPADAPLTSNAAAYIPGCRKCALATDSAVRL
ncbi:MAG TPA: hypothetical protein VFS43_35545 [Polyangiaceae bacterium]|nr:hypothetical protein [Polyangiaceae bacterium]